MPLEGPSHLRHESREGGNRFQHTRCRALREVTIFDNLAWAFETGEACRAPRGSASPWLSQADSSALLQRCAGLHQAGAAADRRRAEDIAAEDCGEVRALKVWLFECDSVASSSSSLLESPLGHLGSRGQSFRHRPPRQSLGGVVACHLQALGRLLPRLLHRLPPRGLLPLAPRPRSWRPLLLSGLWRQPPIACAWGCCGGLTHGAAPLRICWPRGGIRPSLTSALSILSSSSTSFFMSS